MKRTLLIFLLAYGVLGYSQPDSRKSCPLRFEITVAKEIAPAGAKGRLFVFMADSSDNRSILRTGFFSSNTSLAAQELEYAAPGQTIGFDPDLCAFPIPFSHVKPGSYRFMALLDQDHSMAYSGEDGDDLYGSVIAVKNLDPSETAPVALAIDRQMRPDPQFKDTENVKRAEFQSPLLTRFWGRPVTMRAGVVLPPDAGKKPQTRFPAVFHIHGFGGNETEAWMEGPELVEKMRQGSRARMIHIFLNGAFTTGHHEFADSVNNGPWGEALTKEFIPWLQERYPIAADASARFLTGHSSGGWSSLWLQVQYPDFFNGTWSTSPDPVDFRSFTGVDITPGSKDNVYELPDGTARNLVRMNGGNAESIRSFVSREDVQGEYGGQFASFEWVFSPKGQGGRPMHLFNRVTGVVDSDVARAWQKYDIHTVLEKNWSALEPKLRGKIHVFCGTNDTFHLEEATGLLCSFLKDKQSDAVCELIPGRDHFNLYESYKTYPQGLAARIDREMQQRFEKK